MSISQEQIDSLRKSHAKLVAGMAVLEANMLEREKTWLLCCKYVGGYCYATGKNDGEVNGDLIDGLVDKWWKGRE